MTHRIRPNTVRARVRSPLRVPVLATILVLLASALLATGSTAQSEWEPGRTSVFRSDVDVPVDLGFGRDGYVYYPLLQEGEVRRADVETGQEDQDFVLRLPDVVADGGETGLFSIALHGSFHENGILYASYSTRESGEWHNVLSRVTLEDATGAGTEEVLIVRPGGELHNGGRVRIADGHLWWTTGDTQQWDADRADSQVAQEDGNLMGKVLRLTLDGEPAPDNPWNDHAYTKGHRNVFGFAWDPVEERAFITVNGGDYYDYLQILEAGGNYGWPDCDGACDPPRDEYIDPIWQSEYPNPGPTGATWFRGAFWWGGFHTNMVYRTSDRAGTWVTEEAIEFPDAAILAVDTGPDNQSLWVTTWTDIRRVGFPAHDDWPATDTREEGAYWWGEYEPQGGGGHGDGDDDREGSSALAPHPTGPFLLLLAAITIGLWTRRSWRASA